ncbi:MAG: helix-turn-helix transcriptional regulator [Armatimonadetes bacterium]|nr:helix-turn-helix transcriptional regulator [Armatimonadota bacterium]
MSDLQRHISLENEESPEFRAAFEAEQAMLALIRARQNAKLTQQDLATALHVSQPYIAQIENGTRKPGYMLLFRYANAVGAKIQVASPAPPSAKTG